LRWRHECEQVVVSLASVKDGDIRRSAFAECAFELASSLIAVADVKGEQGERDAAGCDAVSQLSAGRGFLAAGGDDGKAVVRQPQGGRSADAAAAADDKCRFLDSIQDYASPPPADIVRPMAAKAGIPGLAAFWKRDFLAKI